jgi:hypothetical protein
LTSFINLHDSWWSPGPPHPSSSPVRILEEAFLNFNKFTSFFFCSLWF